MWAGDIDTGRELPDAAPPRYAVPLLFSVLLHGAVLFLFTRSLFSGTPATDPAEERPSIRVALVVREPLAPAEPAVPEVEERIPPAPEVGEGIPPEPELAKSVPGEPQDLPDARAGSTELLAEAEAAPEAPALSEDEVQEDGGAETGNAEQAWTPARIRTAIETSRSDLRSSATGTWMEECIIERKERGTRDCEQQLEAQDYDSADMAAAREAGAGSFAGVRRANEKWIVEEQYRRKNDAIRGLIDAEGILGEVAATRYYINRDNISYLSGYFGDYVMDAMGNFPADVLGGPRLLVGGSGGNTAFSCAKYVTTKSGRKVKVPAACVYEYTGFRIVRPEAEPDPNEFRVVPQVFGDGR